MLSHTSKEESELQTIGPHPPGTEASVEYVSRGAAIIPNKSGL